MNEYLILAAMIVAPIVIGVIYMKIRDEKKKNKDKKVQPVPVPVTPPSAEDLEKIKQAQELRKKINF